MAGTESIKLQKTISCCGKSVVLEISTEMSLDALDFRLECPVCRSKHAVTLDSFIRNKPAETQASQQLGENPLAFMETPEPQASSEPKEQETRTYYKGESSPLEDLFEGL